MDRMTALPAEAHTKFFRKAFWSDTGEFTKFGQQALKQNTVARYGWALKTSFYHRLRSKRLMRKSFPSGRAFRWMCEALYFVQGHLGEYMWTLTSTVAEGRLMRMRLRAEKKSWTHTDEKIRQGVPKSQRLWAVVKVALVKNFPQGTRTEAGVAEAIEAWLRARLDELRPLFDVAWDTVRLVQYQAPYLQRLVLEILKQDSGTQHYLREKYEDVIHWRLKHVIHQALDDIEAVVDTARQMWFSASSEVHRLRRHDMRRISFAELERHREGLLDMAEAIQKEVLAARRCFRDINFHKSLSLTTRSHHSSSSSMLTKITGLAQIRSKKCPLHNLAMREMRNLPGDDPQRLVVGIWLDLLSSVKGMESKAKEARAAIRRGIQEKFRQPPALQATRIRKKRRRTSRIVGFRAMACASQGPGECQFKQNARAPRLQTLSEKQFVLRFGRSQV